MARFTAIVTVTLKKDILDPAGEATAHTLQQLGYPVAGVRLGRHVALTMDAADEGAALRLSRQMADALLANPIMETYQVQVESLCELE